MTCSTTECGTGIGSVILPGDPSSDSIVTALPVFGGVEVTWTVPSTNPFAVAYVKVWRSQTNSFNAAMQVAASGGDRFFDRIDFANGIFSTQYYWIQFVSINGTVSEPAGPAAALPRATIEQLLDQLTAKIDYNSLSVEMKTTVDKADAYKLAQDLTNGTLAGEQASIRDALALVQEGMDEAFVLISNEVTARQSAGQAFADSLNTLAVSTGESFATVQQDLQAVIDDTSNIVSSIYTVKLTANDLIGGFGLINDSQTVEAGFDVDTFWVGRTQADKKKPFVISNGEVFIDEAAIEKLSFGKLAADDGTLIVEDGKILGEYLSVQELVVGTNPEVAGSTMTGTGAHIYPDGRVVIGDATKNITWDGATLTINGDVIGTSNLNGVAIGKIIAGSFNFVAKTTTGTSTWTVPPNVYKVKVTVVGGGGGGGDWPNYASPGGGGGGAAIGVFNVVPGDVFTCVVGAGGGVASAGASSSFSGPAISVVGGGGQPGVGNSLDSVGVGGTATGGQVNVRGGYGNWVAYGAGPGGSAAFVGISGSSATPSSNTGTGGSGRDGYGLVSAKSGGSGVIYIEY